MASLAFSKDKAGRAARVSAMLSRRHLVGFVFVLPSVLFTTCFFLLPLALTVWMSFNDWTIFGETHFIGVKNYQTMAEDSVYLNSLLFTTKYTLIVSPLICLIGFILALLVSQPMRGVGIFRTAFFMPVVIGLATASYLWVWLYNDQVGPLNGLLVFLHVVPGPIAWFNELNSAFWAVVLVIVWKTCGFSMLLFLIGIQAIPDEFYEAARVDGAGYWRRLFSITIPLLRRTFALILILIVTGSYLAFDQFYIMTHGGPQNQTITVVIRIIQSGFTNFKLGYAAALSITLLFILLIINILQLYILRGSPDE